VDRIGPRHAPSEIVTLRDRCEIWRYSSCQKSYTKIFHQVKLYLISRW